MTPSWRAVVTALGYDKTFVVAHDIGNMVGYALASSVRDRLRHEHVDGKLGGIDRFTTVADVIDHFLGEQSPSVVATKSEP